MKNMDGLKEPTYVTRPFMPALSELTEKLKEVWETKWLTNNGEQHILLESRLRDFLRVPFLSLFNNGTIALLTACRSLGLKGEVITTPFTFPATPHALTWNNITPVFCDIDPDTMNIDAGRIEAAITPETTGILAVHVYGVPCDVAKIEEVAERRGLKVIYDAAHAFGVEIDGKGIGTFGDISMFSFHATKLFHTAEGGALALNGEGLKSKIDLLKNFGIKGEEEVVMAGINGKMNEMQAALGLVVMDYVEEEIQKRKALDKVYRESLKGVEGVSVLPEDMPGVKRNYQYLVLRINEALFGASRNFACEEFRKYNVFARKYFYPLCSGYPHYKDLPSSNPVNLPVAGKASGEVLSMPLYGGLAEDDVVKICGILKSFRGKKR